MNDTMATPAEPPPPGPSLREQVAGMRPDQRYEKLKVMLSMRGSSVSEIARLATKSTKNHPHVSQVLRRLRVGEKTWARLADVLTREELIVLDREDLIKIQVPRRTFQER